ncbi:hypothetical protein FB561_6900 [Kribbella amoyensis]|uniref:Uncharacterized protein n=1 Tax=Kribbella amoyensis TaxID=996641 RepID=A0A561B2D1_9ACTN|nr:hypothetical protein [Kribbella amoyensis]TWD73016.1 hypothetical protein FB561_6900 [Kribbella amoyensis]
MQHAYLADRTPYRSAAEFALGLRDSDLFAVVANTWFWGLQAATFRRGMIPVSLVTQADGRVRYSSRTTEILRAMKLLSIAEARSVLDRAAAEEGLSPERAQRKYDAVAPRQYAFLPAGEHPRCLANMSTLLHRDP